MYILYSSDFKADIFISLNRKVLYCSARSAGEPGTALTEEMIACILVSVCKCRWSNLYCLVMEVQKFF